MENRKDMLPKAELKLVTITLEKFTQITREKHEKFEDLLGMWKGMCTKKNYQKTYNSRTTIRNLMSRLQKRRHKCALVEDQRTENNQRNGKFAIISNK